MKLHAAISLTNVLNLLNQVTTLEVLSSYLKNKGLPFSAPSWEFMKGTRIQQLVDQGRLSVNELAYLLSELEETGRQHIFLFKYPSKLALKTIEYKRISSIAISKGLSDTIHNPTTLDNPNEPTITSIKWVDEADESLIIKLVETRTIRKKVGDEQVGRFYTVRYEDIEERAVNILKIFSDGRVEVRITLQSGSKNYGDAITRFWSQMADFLPEIPEPISISNFKDKVWKNREKLSKVIKFSSSTLKNDYGTTLKAATGKPNGDLNEDEAASESLNSFMKNDGYCDSSNLWFLSQQNGIPSKNIHVVFSGNINEFAITVHCKKADYDYVIGKIRSINQDVS